MRAAVAAADGPVVRSHRSEVRGDQMSPVPRRGGRECSVGQDAESLGPPQVRAQPCRGSAEGRVLAQILGSVRRRRWPAPCRPERAWSAACSRSRPSRGRLLSRAPAGAPVNAVEHVDLAGGRGGHVVDLHAPAGGVLPFQVDGMVFDECGRQRHRYGVSHDPHCHRHHSDTAGPARFCPDASAHRIPAVLAGRTAPAPKRARARSAARSDAAGPVVVGAEGQLPGGGGGVAEFARAQGQRADPGPLESQSAVQRVGRGAESGVCAVASGRVRLRVIDACPVRSAYWTVRVSTRRSAARRGGGRRAVRSGGSGRPAGGRRRTRRVRSGVRRRPCGRGAGPDAGGVDSGRAVARSSRPEAAPRMRWRVSSGWPRDPVGGAQSVRGQGAGGGRADAGQRGGGEPGEEPVTASGRPGPREWRRAPRWAASRASSGLGPMPTVTSRPWSAAARIRIRAASPAASRSK